MVSDRDIELIEKSLAGELTNAEQKEFDLKVQDSSQFRDELHHQSNLLANLDSMQKSALKSEIKDIFDRQSSVQKNSKNGLSYGIAASVLMLIGVTFVLMFNGTNNDDLFEKYFEPYPIKGMVRGTDQDNQSNEIFQLYSTEAYAEVAARIEAQIQNKIFYENQKLILALAYLKLDEVENSIDLLTQSTEGNHNYLDSQWYLALAYVKNGDIDKAKTVLHTLQSKPSIYKSSVRSLLKDIE